MKRSLLKLTAFVFFLSFCVTVVAQEKKLDPKPIVGNWTFTVADVPYGYEKGTAKFSVEKELLKGEFTIEGSSKMAATFTAKAEGYLCTVYVDGYPIEILLTYKEGKLTGRADTGDEYFPISFTKVE